MDLREAEIYEKKLVSLDRKIVDKLLQDKTTKKNIIWATNAYADRGLGFQDKAEMRSTKIFVGLECIIKPRYQKSIEEQAERTRKKAEVMTPTWICNYMNNKCDEDWFGRADAFNTEDGNTWHTVQSKISFPEGKSWKDYVDSRRIEITCGEAPFLVSRYDTTTGESISVNERIGVLDRKLRVVNENTETVMDWIKWAFRAFQATYGYEYQGDNLLLARYNLLLTYWDYYEAKWNETPSDSDLIRLANVISWNLWQMDGLKGTTPLGAPFEENKQISLFDLDEIGNVNENEAKPCIIRDWRSNKTFRYDQMKEEG
ncbi:restriction endonuclease subunit M [Intestinibaculum porci]|uniref:restriction endonuclease subunit M n=1 Tax=Intestinibaculum porci TaxID=2487118 RepID=UPI00240A11A8|nr:restriction endonuclease subunit M [Intestinibaculum porci]MDD6348366.1 restriction endonuclease subunit M [Intestinibaculum porci]